MNPIFRRVFFCNFLLLFIFYCEALFMDITVDRVLALIRKEGLS